MKQQWWSSDGSIIKGGSNIETESGAAGAAGAAESNTTSQWIWTQGPFVSCSVFGGVTYDSRLETPGWTTSSYKPSVVQSAGGAAGGVVRLGGKRDELLYGTVPRWKPASIQPTMTPANVGVLKSAMTPLIRRTQSFKAISISVNSSSPTSKSYDVDFGQNAAASVSVKVPELYDGATGADAAAGTYYTLRISCSETQYGPKLDDADVVYVFDAESAARNKGATWSSSFTYAGFRYCTLTISSSSSDEDADTNMSSVAPPLPPIDITTVESHFTHSDVTPASDISFSALNSHAHLLDRIQQATR